MAQPDDSQSPPGALALPPTFAAIAAALAVDPSFTSRFAPFGVGHGVPNESGWYFGPPMQSSMTSTPALNVVHLVPILIAEPVTVDRMVIEVTTAVATATPRLGIYKRTSGKNIALILDAGTVDGSTTGTKEIVVSVALTTGSYFLAFCNQVAAVAVRSQTPMNLSGVGTSVGEVSGVYPVPKIFVAVSGAFPATEVLNIPVGPSPRIMLRIA